MLHSFLLLLTVIYSVLVARKDGLKSLIRGLFTPKLPLNLRFWILVIWLRVGSNILKPDLGGQKILRRIGKAIFARTDEFSLESLTFPA